jgi:hypothetical protein
MSKNMELWNKVCKTDPNFTKKVANGAYKFTAADAQYQIRSFTKEFGVFGIDWGIRNENFRVENIGDEVLIIYQASLFLPGGETSIHSSINAQKNKKIYENGKHVRTDKILDDDCIKKVATDALTKAFSKLGFNADIFLGMFDDNKYVDKMKKEFSNALDIELTKKVYEKLMSKPYKAKDKEFVQKLKDLGLDPKEITNEQLKTILKGVDENV